jgi:hypothetical protein
MTAVAQPGLLVSVRCGDEAEAALAGGADLIDVKEPARGALGRADDATIADVVRAVAGRVLVSAAMGELSYRLPPCTVPGVAFVKWGLAGWGLPPETERLREMDRIRREQEWYGAPGCRPVFVAYADWQRANAPPPEVLCQLARHWRLAGFVIDTFIKDGTTLLDWLPAPTLLLLCRLCRAAGLRVALAGSLGVGQIVQLRHVQPDWFAVRGAACREGRQGAIDPARVRELKHAIASGASVSFS